MKLNKLSKTANKKKKRVGRGYGSGKGGHTVGRGAKGLKARGKVKLTFEGTKTKKSFDRWTSILVTEAPSVLRIPTSLVDCSAINEIRPTKPNEAIKMAINENVNKIIPTLCSAL